MPNGGHRRIGEPQLNVLLAKALEQRHPRWKVGAEQTRTIRGSAGLRPDLLIEHPNGQPLIIETEISPATSVEQDAGSRLGAILEPDGNLVEQVVALRIPRTLTFVERDLSGAMERVDYEYVSLSLAADGTTSRWPASGWLKGRIDDLANLCENIALSEQALAAGLARLEYAVSDIAIHMRKTAPPAILVQMADELKQEEGEQSSRMAAAIILNAVTFHAALAGHHGISSIDRMYITGRPGLISKRRIVICWDDILNVNYWPIFHIAIRVLLPIPYAIANRVLGIAAAATADLAGIGVTTMHDLAGRMFQQLIADRKFLATFYTLPPSAAMIAELAVARLDTPWGDDSSVTEMRAADLACGTGTLLSAAYRAIRSRHRRAGGDDTGIHPAMMEKGLIAADVMPQAAHLTASMLSSAHPSIPFGNTQVYTLPYGVSTEHGVSIGSLELLGVDALASLFPTGERQAHGTGDQGRMVLRRESLDLVIMNPPFTRPTNHENWKGAIHPNFAGLGNDPQATAAMAHRLKQYRRKLPAPVGHGNAGLGSDFCDLAHLKLKDGGRLALVLPFSVIAGGSWKKFRELLTKHYSDVIVVSIAASGSTDRAFSADTGMADVVVIATKSTGRGRDNVLFVNLYRRPESLPEAVEIARLVIDAPADEPNGYLTVGDDLAGKWLRGSLVDGGGAAALSEPGVAATMTNLPAGRLVLPRRGHPFLIPMTTLAEIGKEGLVHRDIGFKPGAKGDTRGPFVIYPMSGVPEYPVLWAHSAPRERTLVVEPDSRGLVRTGLLNRALEVWDTATLLHFNLDFRLNSQSLASCLTPERTIGGRAWPSFQPHDECWALPLLLWTNTTLGMMCFWWTANRQQQGRAALTITALPDLPVLDPRHLDEHQLAKADRIFKNISGRSFLPANEAYRDEVRQELDRAVLVDLLRLPEDVLEPLKVLRLQWCSEPSVHGGKSTRPS